MTTETLADLVWMVTSEYHRYYPDLDKIIVPRGNQPNVVQFIVQPKDIDNAPDDMFEVAYFDINEKVFTEHNPEDMVDLIRGRCTEAVNLLSNRMGRLQFEKAGAGS